MFEKPYFEKNQNILFALSLLVFQAREERNKGKTEEKTQKMSGKNKIMIFDK